VTGRASLRRRTAGSNTSSIFRRIRGIPVQDVRGTVIRRHADRARHFHRGRSTTHRTYGAIPYRANAA
jgi:hypothetical protein